jgi:uncharacterized protein (DUF58 family)
VLRNQTSLKYELGQKVSAAYSFKMDAYRFFTLSRGLYTQYSTNRVISRENSNTKLGGAFLRASGDVPQRMRLTHSQCIIRSNLTREIPTEMGNHLLQPKKKLDTYKNARSTYKLFVHGKKSLGRKRSRWENNIQLHHREKDCGVKRNVKTHSDYQSLRYLTGLF